MRRLGPPRGGAHRCFFGAIIGAFTVKPTAKTFLHHLLAVELAVHASAACSCWSRCAAARAWVGLLDLAFRRKGEQIMKNIEQIARTWARDQVFRFRPAHAGLRQIDRYPAMADSLRSKDVSVSFDGFKALNNLKSVFDDGELRCIIGQRRPQKPL